MRAHDNGSRDAVTEKIIVLRLLEDHAEPVARSELYATRLDIDAARFDAAILSLAEAQVERSLMTLRLPFVVYNYPNT